MPDPAPPPFVAHPDWIEDCLLWRKRVLTGMHAHWCFEWDGLPVDETTPEWPCGCERADASAAHAISDVMSLRAPGACGDRLELPARTQGETVADD